ncbi:endo alpha-1,4 polygalactosaminidase [Sulfurimonas sp. SAG-AH-194-C20]|nr:endo alpha-1,4 polygalactosaminidase [Sulfurimonas sp. SAG-AH-194-C20]MDF1878385.1 endo alpha-1,4 polygalactosaminidase [Sulfurimonas sp. SAG-AH-194-C20]
MRLFLLLFLISLSPLYASLSSKSAMVYYGEKISYSMVGIHEYIIVQPHLTNTYTHGFSLYKDQMYAYVSIGELDRTLDIYKDIKQEWIVAQNKAWKSDVLDLKNREYREFMFKKLIEPARKKGFKNFFFDTLDSYEFYSKTQKQRLVNRAALVSFIEEFHNRYPDSKLILNRGFNIIDEVHEVVEAVLFESYYQGISGENLVYKAVSQKDREWLERHITKIKAYGLDVICLDYLDFTNQDKTLKLAKQIEKRGMIPYISTKDLTRYGVSSKNAIKREIFTLIDSSRTDVTEQGLIINSGVVFEYMGYMQHFHDINKGLPKVEKMLHYKGVVIWLQQYYKHPSKMMTWITKLKDKGIKVVFVGNFGVLPTNKFLEPLGIKVDKVTLRKEKIINVDPMMGYEIDPSMSLSSINITPKNAKPLLRYRMVDRTESTLAALTSWGGYAVGEACINSIGEDNLWVVNPFEFFKKALRLKSLLVPDTTTQNGKRLLFSHIDGDGIMNKVEGDHGYYSGDVILNKILKVYKVPHSVSLIGAEISSDGLYKKESAELMSIAKEMYSLNNVEPATHTYTHPFFWKKIKDDKLDEKYRLKPKGYSFSLQNELSGSLNFLRTKLQPKREAKSVFWSGDCMPQNNALEYVYKNNILNINGGDTTITDLRPWLSAIAPMGLKRDEYVQVFTGAQNENVYTNNWLGPYWGFKRVVQTFELTNEPLRLKPIDIYYHIYSGSKQASLKALEYVFDWAIQEDVMPIYTSEYIPKVMDYYDVSIANEGKKWLLSGLNDLKTLRVTNDMLDINLEESPHVLGVKKEQEITYISLGARSRYLLNLNQTNLNSQSYIISSNAKIDKVVIDKHSTIYNFKAYVGLKVDFHLSSTCSLSSEPTFMTKEEDANHILLIFGETKEASVTVICEK